MSLSVELFHARHELEKVLHSNELAVKSVVSLCKPDFEERCYILENTEKAHKDRMK